MLPDGSVLRALQPARPSRDSLFSDVLMDGRSLLKVRRGGGGGATAGKGEDGRSLFSDVLMPDGWAKPA